MFFPTLLSCPILDSEHGLVISSPQCTMPNALLFDVFEAQFQLNCLTIVSLALVIYDHCLTFSMEVRFSFSIRGTCGILYAYPRRWITFGRVPGRLHECSFCW